MWRLVSTTLVAALVAALATHAWLAQNAPAPQSPTHGAETSMPRGGMPHMSHAGGASGAPALSGQDAFGAIAEVVRILDADPATDWSKVDLERLRQHLIDMNEVVLRADVKATPVPGGLVMDVVGTGRTEAAIRAMLVPHTVELDRMPPLSAKSELIPGGVRWTVTSRTPADAKAVARVRALGFAGLLTLGAHHAPHHLAMARGEADGHSH